jgi:hypothetical protein
MAAMNDHEQEHLEKRRQLENALEQARFEVARAHRQYDQVDPDNRLVAGELYPWRISSALRIKNIPRRTHNVASRI